MADKQAISEILGKMGWAYDSGNLDYLETVYTDDARFTISIAGLGQVGEYQTKTTIMGLYRGAKAGQTDTRRHVVSNIFLAEDSASTATAVSYLSLFVRNAEGVKVLSTGEYTDKFVLLDGAWKIAHRNLALDAPY